MQTCRHPVRLKELVACMLCTVPSYVVQHRTVVIFHPILQKIITKVMLSSGRTNQHGQQGESLL